MKIGLSNFPTAYSVGPVPLARAMEERGRPRSEIDVSVMTMIESKDRLAELQAKGVSRVILSLPTLPESEALAVIDGYLPVLQWAREFA